MKNLIVLKITKSLCAVFLALSLLICANPLVIYAEDIVGDETTETNVTESTESTTPIETLADEPVLGETTSGEVTQDPATGNTYRYCLDIYFGEMRFYYDWGTWNPDELQYKANTSSTNPAKSTNSGMPGWYGFDGIMNKISFYNSSPSEDNIWVRLEYVTEQYGTDLPFPTLHDSISMEFYQDQAFNQQIVYDKLDNGVLLSVKHSPLQTDDQGNEYRASTDVYVSMSGSPYLLGDRGDEDLQMFHSTAESSIGFLRVTVGVKEEDLLEVVSADNEEPSFFVNERGEIVDIENGETTTTETTSAEETTTTETTSVEETTTTETTSVEETTTTETTSVEETTETETISIE